MTVVISAYLDTLTVTVLVFCLLFLHLRIKVLSVQRGSASSPCFSALISMGAMVSDWLMAAGQSKLLRLVLYLAINAASLSLLPSLSPWCFPLPLIPQHSAHLGKD